MSEPGTLPVVELPSRFVDGLTVYSLTRSEARHVQIAFHAADDTDLADVEAKVTACEVYTLARGLRVEPDAAAAWRDASPAAVVDRVVESILYLSGLASDDPASKDQPDPKGSMPGR